MNMANNKSSFDSSTMGKDGTDAFSRPRHVIKFGTDGFRGIIAKDFTFETVEKITNAIAKYLKDKGLAASTILIGYDPRFMADKFSKFSAELLEKYGYRAILSSRVCPTPTLAYSATITPDCSGAIMFTASHNPCEYLGMKFIPPYGGPATVEITDAIVVNLDAAPTAEQGGKIELKDFSEEYFEHIEKLIDFEKIASSNIKIIYDALFSASVGYFDELLRRNNVKFESFNDCHDPLFGGGMPEPIKKYMHNYKEGFITLSNDGDADRYGIIDENTEWVSPNVIMALLLIYLSKNNKKGKLIKTVGASGLLDACAQKLGIETVTTPVGFKWVGEAMREHETLLAGEDSGGLSIGSHIPEKDGILANALILEMLANEKKTLVELQEELKKFVGKEFFTDRLDIKQACPSAIEKIIYHYKEANTLAGLKIVKTLEIDGLKLFLNDGYTCILIRPSGTEPLLRFYIESDDLTKIKLMKDFILKNIPKIRV